MKNKKLFAILTLVCFMFTLMPVAAFAATTTYDNDQVYVCATGGNVVINDDNDGTEVTVTVADPANGIGFDAYVGAGASVTSSGYVFYVVDENGNYIDVNMTGAFTGLKVAGDYTVSAINVSADAANNYANVDAELKKIASVESKVETIKTWAGAAKYVNGTATVIVETPEYKYQIVLDEYTKNGYTATSVSQSVNAQNQAIAGKYEMTIEASDGFEKDGQVVAQLQRAQVAADGTVGAFANFPRAGLELSISEAGYVDVAYDTLKTNNKGQVVFVVTADLANVGNKVIVKYGNEAKAELTVNATAATVANVAVSNEPKAPQNNTNTVLDANVEFKFTDANGVAAELAMVEENNVATNVVDLTASDVVITVVEKPAKSNLKDANFQLVKQPASTGVEKDGAGVYTLDLKVNNGKVDKDGKYVVKVAMKNGASATATFEVAKMGEVVGIMFVKAPTTIAYGETESVSLGRVVAVDANGVVDKTITPDSVSASGLAVESFNFNAPTLKVWNDEKYIGETITMLAVYGDFTATTDIVVVDKAATIKYVSPKAEVGINTTLVGQIKDATGKVVPVTGVTGVKMIVLDKPENAVAVATSAAGNNLKDNNVIMSFLASAPGEYKVQTVVTYASGAKYISGIETITVGGGVNAMKDVVVVSMGANSMIVGNKVVALDVAPYITEGRTMLQFNVLGAFGIDVQWDEATRSVIAEGNGVKVVLTIDSKVAVVNGQEVALDVAPTIVNGRTVVPVGFITGNFGIVPTFTYNADGTIADILFTK